MNPFIVGVGSGIVGQHLYEEWLMPITRDGSGRGVEPSADAPVRTILRREPINRGDTPIIRTIQGVVASPRNLPSPRQPMMGRGGRLLGGESPNPPASPGSGAGSEVPAPLPGQRRYPGDDPLAILADVFSSMFGFDETPRGEQQYSVVPQLLDGGKGGGNTFLILIILAAAGFGLYYFYFRG